MSEAYKGGERCEGRRVYIGNINYEVKEEELRGLFDQYGAITNISYKQGYAFIDFQDARDAQEAIAKMDGYSLAGRRMTVEHSKDASEIAARPPRDRDDYRYRPAHREDYRADTRGNFHGGGGNSRNPNSSELATKNLFVANIPDGLSEAEVQDHFSKYGKVLTVKFLPQKSDTKAAFVDFDHVDDAREAHDETNVLRGSRLRTDYNKRGGGPPGGGGAGGGDRSGGDRGYGRADDRRYDERRYDSRPPGYDERRYESRPPPPRYDDRRYEGRDEYRRDDMRERDYHDDHRYDDRRYESRPPPPRYDDRRYEGRDEYRRDDVRERDYHDDRRYDERPSDRYDDRRYDSRPPPRYEEPRYDDRRRDERRDMDERGRYDPRDQQLKDGPGPAKSFFG